VSFPPIIALLDNWLTYTLARSPTAEKAEIHQRLRRPPLFPHTPIHVPLSFLAFAAVDPFLLHFFPSFSSLTTQKKYSPFVKFLWL
jgi:hypothetical protein